MTVTLLANQINPQVLMAMVSAQLEAKIAFSPLAEVGTRLVGMPGNTITMPKFKYVGDAKDLAENVADVPVLLETTSSQVTVKKASKAVEITDEALLSGYGDPANEIGKQLVMALANKIDNDCIEALSKLPKERTYENKGALTKEALIKARVLFGEKLGEETFVFVSPAQYAELLLDKDFVQIQLGQALITGHVGQLGGCYIVVSEKIDAKAPINYMVRRGAIGIELKRETLVEYDRDTLKYTNLYTGSKHYVAYVKDDSKAVKITNTVGEV